MSKDATEEELVKDENPANLEVKEIKSKDDDPSRQYGFLQFKKVVSEMPLNNCSVGSIIGAMVNQIGMDKGKLI